MGIRAKTKTRGGIYADTYITIAYVLVTGQERAMARFEAYRDRNTAKAAIASERKEEMLWGRDLELTLKPKSKIGSIKKQCYDALKVVVQVEIDEGKDVREFDLDGITDVLADN